MNDAYDKPQGAVQIVLLHQLSLFRYPPAVNLLRTLQRQVGIAVAVVTRGDVSAPGAALPSDQPVCRHFRRTTLSSGCLALAGAAATGCVGVTDQQ